jgi:predicted DNA-binding transcriptional regulator AlpA
MSAKRRFVPDRQVRDRYSISEMTLWRWDHKPQVGFPKAVWINGRKYRDEAELDAFDATCAAERDKTEAA